MKMEYAIKHLEDLKLLLDVKNISVDGIPLPNLIYTFLFDSIVNLLKDQSPHLLTLEEVRQSDAVFLETHGWSGLANEEIHETVLHTDEDRYDFSDVIVQFVDQEGCEIVCVKDRYNIEWRCWNRKPSYEQWKEAKWDE